MKTNRLPPQPVDTALARLVRRLIDRLPAMISIGNMRLFDAQMIDLVSRNQNLRIENQMAYDQIVALHRDIKALARKVPQPTVDFAETIAIRSEDKMGTRVRVRVTYRDSAYTFCLNDFDLRHMSRTEVSQWGCRALKDAAHEIAAEHAKTHAQYIIDATLNQGIFKP